MASEQRRRCVRCGNHPRWWSDEGEAYLCWACASDPATDAEVETATDQAPDVIERRRYVIEHYGWAGGWGMRA